MIPLCEKRGATRTVFLFKENVIKVPICTLGSKHFLTGLLANQNEMGWDRSKLPHERNLPEIRYVAPFGLFLIMKRYRPVKHRGLFWVHLMEVIKSSSLHEDFWLSDAKPENFGFDGATLIKLDSGN
jgi:hypothetical protein